MNQLIQDAKMERVKKFKHYVANELRVLKGALKIITEDEFDNELEKTWSRCCGYLDCMLENSIISIYEYRTYRGVIRKLFIKYY